MPNCESIDLFQIYFNICKLAAFGEDSCIFSVCKEAVCWEDPASRDLAFMWMTETFASNAASLFRFFLEEPL